MPAFRVQEHIDKLEAQYTCRGTRIGCSVFQSHLWMSYKYVRHCDTVASAGLPGTYVTRYRMDERLSRLSPEALANLCSNPFGSRHFAL